LASLFLQQLSEHVYAWIGSGGDSNAGAAAALHGPIAIDAQQTADLGLEFRSAIEAAIGGRAVALINTHLHLDHTTGNVVFSEVPILAHRRTLEMLEAELGPARSGRWSISDVGTKLRLFFGSNINELLSPGDPLRGWFVQRVSGPAHECIDLIAPSKTFEESTTIQTLAGPMHLRYWGPAHCDGDLVVHLPRARIAFLGDLLFVGRFPWLGDCDLDGWIDVLGRLLNLEVEMVVPGHGPVSTLREVNDFRDLLIALRTAVRKRIMAGASEDAVARETQLLAFAHLPRYREWLEPNIRSAYRYLRVNR